MTKWYDRIGNSIEMRVGNQWIKGIVVNGYRTQDGLITMKTEDDKTYWCGSAGEYIHFRKCEDSLGDLINNSDRIRSMPDEELAEWLVYKIKCTGCNAENCNEEFCVNLMREWIESPYKEQ